MVCCSGQVFPVQSYAASVKQARRRIRDGIVGSTFSVHVRTVAPMATKDKAGCWITKPMIIGAIIKAARSESHCKAK